MQGTPPRLAKQPSPASRPLHRNYRACVRAHKMALSAQRTFWMALLHDTVHFKSLQRSFRTMNKVGAGPRLRPRLERRHPASPTPAASIDGRPAATRGGCAHLWRATPTTPLSSHLYLAGRDAGVVGVPQVRAQTLVLALCGACMGALLPPAFSAAPGTLAHLRPLDANPPLTSPRVLERYPTNGKLLKIFGRFLE